ncbi:MAG: FKBP-type peptidyl-prolyl cis-trans isomerase [Candidatus Paceibacterota bacterium]
MNTKTIIGIIIAIAVIGLVTVWLTKTPASTNPNMTVTTGMDSGSGATIPTTTTTPPVTQTPATAAPVVKGSIISTKTINGMKIEVTKEGTGTLIKSGQTAVMLYTGKLTDGSIFDSTAKRNNDPFSFHLGAGEVIKGWDQGIVGMKVGEQRTLTIPPELGYGAAGYPPVIPQNATLVFDVTLAGIK